jgi:uncharacterized membrane protein
MLLKFALFFHVMSAVFWIGGMLFLTLVIVPFIQTMPDPATKSKIYQTVGRKYRTLGWIAIITLLITGPVILYTLYGIAPSDIFSAKIHATGFGKALAWKLAFVTLLVISSLVHDFYIGPKAKESPRLSRMARIFGRSNLLVALVIVVFAVILRSGGF